MSGAGDGSANVGLCEYRPTADLNISECRFTGAWCFVVRRSKTPTSVCKETQHVSGVGDGSSNVGLCEYRPTGILIISDRRSTADLNISDRRSTRAWCFVGRRSKTPTSVCKETQLVSGAGAGSANVGLCEYRPTGILSIFDRRSTADLNISDRRPTR